MNYHCSWFSQYSISSEKNKINRRFRIKDHLCRDNAWYNYWHDAAIRLWYLTGLHLTDMHILCLHLPHLNSNCRSNHVSRSSLPRTKIYRHWPKILENSNTLMSRWYLEQNYFRSGVRKKLPKSPPNADINTDTVTRHSHKNLSTKSLLL